MKESYRNFSLRVIVRQNKILLLLSITISIVCLLLSIKAFQKEENFILIPATNVEKHLKLSNKTFYQSYLSEWTKSVMHEIFTTSYLEIDSQMSNLRAISDVKSEPLEKFLKDQTSFIKGNRVSSVFFMKESTPQNNNQIKVTGTIHYWFGDSSNKIAQEKVFLLTYKTIRGSLIILSNVKEVTNDS